MGKLVKKLVVGAAIIGLAVATGGISLGVSGAFLGIATTGVLGSLALTVGAGAILGGLEGALAKKPPVSQSSISMPPRTMMPGGAIRMAASRTALTSGAAPAGMPPIRPWRHRRRRWALHNAIGDCMVPHWPDGVLALMDREAQVRPGDLVTFEVARRLGGTRLTKRFVRRVGDRIEFETTNPSVEGYSIAQADVRSLYRVRRWIAEKQAYGAAVAELEAKASIHNERLGQCTYPADYDFRAMRAA